MNVPPPAPKPFSIADWGILVGIVTTVAGALYAVWRIVLMPMLRALARRLLHSEMSQLARNDTQIGQIWSAQLAVQSTVDDMKPKVDRLPFIEDLLVQMVNGGRRKGDHR